MKRWILDNFSLEKDEKELTLSSEAGEGEDIEFDENFDIDAIQKTLQQHMDSIAETPISEDETLEDKTASDAEQLENNTIEPEISAETFLEEITPSLTQNEPIPQEYDFEKIVPSFMQNLPSEINPNSKKYVIYIEPENIDFIENLSIDERKLVINKILNEQHALSEKQKAAKERMRFFKHAILCCLTAIIGLPCLFYLVNKSIELTIQNYKSSEQNFVELYKAKGKIPPSVKK